MAHDRARGGHSGWLAAVPAALLALAGCNPDLPDPSVRPTSSDAFGLTLQLAPEAPPGAAPRVLRAEIRAPPRVVLDPARFVVIEGEVGEAHLRQLERDAPSRALAARFVPALTWAESGAVVVAPSIALTPGESYAIASGEPPVAFALRVADEGPPLLARVWPPAGAAATAASAVLCGDEPLPPMNEAVALDPEGVAATLVSGAARGAGRACLRLEAEGSADAIAPRIPPPVVETGGRSWLLDPAPWTLDAEPTAEAAPVACEAGEVPFGPGCARVLDDRVAVRAPSSPLLWIVSGAGLDVVRATGADEPFVLAPLAPNTSIRLRVTTIDAAGHRKQVDVGAVTRPPLPHLVLNEVMANPLGPEPEAEWVELVNDGLAPADLAGYVLADVGGETALPAATLAPGAFAVLVNEDFAPDPELDVPPREGALVLRVAALGKGGLGNDGEPLRLLDPSGAVASRFSAAPKPKPGVSVGRTSPSAPDGVAASFALQARGATPGWENSE
jgi:hypothetical protein